MAGPDEKFSLRIPVVLASSSSYRRLLLARILDNFQAVSPDIDESPQENELARDLALRLSASKAKALRHRFPQHWIIGSDQVAVCAKSRFGKPGTADIAVEQLLQASGNCVRFYTAVSLLSADTGQIRSEVNRCDVYFRTLRRKQIEHYVAIEQPLDCAGSFRAEGLGIALIERIDGNDPSALIGLPLILLVSLMEESGVQIL